MSLKSEKDCQPKRIALFGGTGFVGGYLVDALIEAGMHPVLLVRRGSERKVRQPDRCTLIAGDIDNVAAVERVVQETDAVIYNIGILREFPRRGITFEKLHYDAARRTMDAASRAGVKRFLLMSANGVKAEGTAYQRTKYQAEEYLRSTGLEWTVFRPSVLFGDPRGTMEFASQLANDLIRAPLPAPLFYDGLLPFNAGGFRMAPIHVADVACAFVTALQEPKTIGSVLHLGGLQTTSWRQILSTLSEAVGRSKWMVPAPAWGVHAVAALFDRFEVFPVTRDQIRMLLEGNTCPENGCTALGITPKPFTAENLQYLNYTTEKIGSTGSNVPRQEK